MTQTTNNDTDIVVCALTSEEHPRSEMFEAIIGLVHESHRDEFTVCHDCSRLEHHDDIRYVPRHNIHICQDCLDNGDYAWCENCGDVDYVHEMLNWSGETVCPSCYDSLEEEHDDYYDDDDSFNTHRVDMSDTSHRSRAFGDTIQSNRKFGVELEVIYPDRESLKKAHDALPHSLGWVGDGSVEGSGIEIVTPVINGKKGEKLIKKISKELIDNNFTLNRTCGMHIHIDGERDFTVNPRPQSMQQAELQTTAERMQQSYDRLRQERDNMLNMSLPTDMLADSERSALENAMNTALGQLETRLDERRREIHECEQRLQDLTQSENGDEETRRDARRKRDKAFHNIKVLWLFHLVFEDIIHSFLPKTRRTNNYCRSLKRSYSYDEIFKASNIEALEKIHYRMEDKQRIERAKAERYNQLRYKGINFHSLLANGHLEVRYHSGTTNAEKVLQWLNLHLRIADRIAVDKITIEDIEQASTLVFFSEKLSKFFELVELDEKSQRYFLARVQKFMPSENEGMLQEIVSDFDEILQDEVTQQ